ncbi:CIC11C00000000269 [Sungouiella intermedia]|uniref:Aspartate aminotransferase n=1 Tax=Sungouiella intermedia TaxID=45354 RepID=A0A1L0G2Z8_9ASCO|nr:CIC11C00000000269 [[Candida] intermedia]
MSHFFHLQAQPVDEFNDIRKKLNADSTFDKIDVSAGVYRDHVGEPYTFPSVTEAKSRIIDKHHDYNLCMGIPDFVSGAAKIAVGENAVNEGRVASCQTVGGTGACHLGALFLVQKCGYKNFYLGTPAWPNYTPLIIQSGGSLSTYKYFDSQKRAINFEAVQAALKKAEPKSVFVFQLCCHNPTATDLTMEQWTEVAQIMKERGLIAFFDSAYQGLATGSVEEDGAPVQMFVNEGLEIVVAQSFSKSLGLYGERIGCLHVVTNESTRELVADQLRYIFRAECSSSPAFGARIVSTVLNDNVLRNQWKHNLTEISSRLVETRKYILQKLTDKGTPGNWTSVIGQRGLFWFSGLNEVQSLILMNKMHVYLPKNGRINIAGLNSQNIDRFCDIFHDIVVSKI